MMKKTRQETTKHVREEIKNYREKIKQQRKILNTFMDYTLHEERHIEGIVSQLTDTSMQFMEIHEQNLDGIAKLNHFASKMKYTNKNLLETIIQLMDNTAFAIYNQDQIFRILSKHISSSRKDLAGGGNDTGSVGNGLNKKSKPKRKKNKQIYPEQHFPSVRHPLLDIMPF